MSKLEIKPGTKFGRLTVLKEVAMRNKQRYMLVQCVCGVKREVMLAHLRNGHTQSCGCFRRDHASQTRVTHGMRGTRLYSIWCGIKQRCNNPAHSSYSSYGGRGITICKSWSDPKKFIKWALANGYTAELSIDRKNNGRGYSPKNCRWCTPLQQTHNRRLRPGKSGFIGVYKRGNKWHARATIQYQSLHLGTFTDGFSAAWIRDEFVKNIDQYATTNNLIDRRKQKKRIAIDKRGTYQPRVQK